MMFVARIGYRRCQPNSIGDTNRGAIFGARRRLDQMRHILRREHHAHKFPDEVAQRVQARAAQLFASAEDVARTILFAVTQPVTLNMFEIVVRPQRGLPDSVTRPATSAQPGYEVSSPSE